ncbi:hypothetical protein [Methanosalsum zhilinae]|nr:hypothetical protein [Methanosalsum zhilinae]
MVKILYFELTKVENDWIEKCGLMLTEYSGSAVCLNTVSTGTPLIVY